MGTTAVIRRRIDTPVKRVSWQLLVSVVCMAVLVVGLFRQILPQDYQAPDFVNTYNAALAMRLGDDPYTRAIAWVQSYVPGNPLADQYFYAPTFALLLIPLTFLPYQAALSVWGVCISGFLCLAVYALMRSVTSRPSLNVVLILITAASLMSAVRAEYFLGQANLFMLVCICSAVWARETGRPGLAGTLLALALVTKPMLLLVAVVLLWKREFKFALTTIAGFIVFLVSPFLWLGGQVLSDLLTLWQFYSTRYLSFSENIAPRGMLERLFSTNPYVRPLLDMPALATALWILLAAAIFCVMLAVIAPRPFQRDNRSLLEIGVIMSGLLLVSPLTEPPYLVLLIIPLIASFNYLRSLDLTTPRYRFAAIALAAVWGAQLIPRRYIETFFWQRTDTSSISSDLFVTLAPSHFYILLATFGLQLYVLSLASNTSTVVAVRCFIRDAPRLALEWLRDAHHAMKPSARRMLTDTPTIDLA